MPVHTHIFFCSSSLVLATCAAMLASSSSFSLSRCCAMLSMSLKLVFTFCAPRPFLPPSCSNRTKVSLAGSASASDYTMWPWGEVPALTRCQHSKNRLEAAHPLNFVPGPASRVCCCCSSMSATSLTPFLAAAGFLVPMVALRGSAICWASVGDILRAASTLGPTSGCSADVKARW